MFLIPNYIKFNNLIHSSPSSIFESLYSNLESFKRLFKIPLWCELITPLLTLQYLVKIWSENRISITMHSGISYFWMWLSGWGVGIKQGTRQGQEALMSNHCLISHCWYDVENLTVSGSSNSKVQQKVLC